ncbi:hypothetical protein HB364_17310 [Pseudoflavitalea sp. X16]|uniref:ligand-binding sensor domain-containing protein n=1 Tax=Paraflavitalea devenefica TaxID=2716334 RepID=UPI0014231373|nr:sensor histidine kinase [Paraflavitalea devenefica]NII26852.1 hypothetical protein [Paraflavitalea devenefica]
MSPTPPYMHLRLLLCILFSHACLMAGAQKVNEYQFTSFNTNNGLSANAVLNVIQDHKGFMWLATTNGLQRYDGKRFLTFRNKPGDPQTIPHNIVEGVYEDTKHNLWVQTADDKVGIFSTTHFTYREIPIRVRDKKELMSIKYLMEDREGNLYLLLHQYAIYLFSAKTQEFTRSPLNEVLPAGWTVYELLIDHHSRNFWMACDSGLAVYNVGNKQVSYRGNNRNNDPVIAALGQEKFPRTLHIDRNRHFWCSTPHAEQEAQFVVHRFDPSTGTHDRHIPFPALKPKNEYHELKKIYSQKNGRTWLCGLPFLMEYKKAGLTVFEKIPVNETCNPRSLVFDMAVDMYEDREQNLWVSTTHGLFRFNPDANFFSNYLLQRRNDPAAVEQPVTAVGEMKNGDIWIGTAGAGLYTYGKDFTPVAPKGDPAAQYTQRSIWAIYQHSLTGQVWMGYTKGQMILYDPNTGQSEQFAPEIIAGKIIRRITEDKKGNLWFSTWKNNTGDIIKWDRQLAGNDHKKGYVLVKAFQETMPTNIIIDQHNFAWVTMYNQGLYKIDAATHAQIDHITTAKPEGYRLADDGLSDIIEYNDSLLVIAGAAIQVMNTKTGRISIITRQDGLPGSVLSIAKDNQGILWLGLLENGLCRFNLSKNIFTVYDKRDGMLDEFFSQAAHLKLNNGRLLFYGGRNIMVFQPADMIANAQATPGIITDFKLLNISLPVDSLLQLARLTLPYDKNSVTIEFSALSFKSQNKINFYYKMEGLDKDWIPADESLRAIYNYLPSGKYTFHIKTDNGADTNGQVTSLKINVEAPFWKTWWFYLTLTLLIVIILYVIDRERIKRLVGLQRIRTEIAINLHQEVSSTLNSINMLGEMARIKADRDIERSKEYIRQISDKSSHMVTAMEDILWSLDPDNDSMEKSLLRMREYIDALKNRYAASIDLTVDKKVTAVKLDMKKRLEFFILFKESLRAIIQHAEGKETLINLGLSGNKLLLTIQDATAHPAINTPELEKLIKDLHGRSAFINAETEVQRDRNGMAIILLVPMG